MSRRGFTLIEVVVALLIFSMIAVALTETLLGAQRAQVASGRWLRAVALAEQAIEAARMNGSAGEDSVGPFHRTWSVATTNEELGLARIDVVVQWNLPSPQEFRLATLVKR